MRARAKLRDLVAEYDKPVSFCRLPRRKHHQPTRYERRRAYFDALDARLLDPANVLSDEAWREAPRASCEMGTGQGATVAATATAIVTIQS